MKTTIPALCLALTASPLFAQGLLPYADAARVANGAEIYADNCAACHGTDLSGQPDWKVRDSAGYLPAPPHDETGHTWHHPDAMLIKIVMNGTEALVGGSYKSNMAGFGDQLSQDNIVDALAFIKSTWPAQVIAIHNDINAKFEAAQN
jgi:mono/diheme cytochrome c family protein